MSFLDEATVNCGMYGYIEYNAGIHSIGNTYLDIDQPLRATGILSRVHMRLFGNGSDVGSCKIAILTPQGGSSYLIVGVINITAAVNAVQASGRFEFDTDTVLVDMGSISVTKGDVLGFYSDANVYVGFNTSRTGFTTIFENSDVLTSGTVTVDDGTNATHSFVTDVYVTTNESIIFDDDTGYGDGDSILIPTLTSEIYNIILEDVIVPDGEDLEIHLIVRNPSSASDLTGNKLYFDMTQAAGSDVIALLGWDDAVLDSNIVTFEGGAENDIYTGFITVDPLAAGNRSMKMSYANYQNGQGPVGGGANSLDILHASFLLGRWFTRRQGVNRVTKELKITNAGGNASIGRILVTRKSIVAIGDSFAGKHNNDAAGTALSHVATELSDDGRFTEDRYIIRGGATGNSLLLDTPAVFQSIAHRFDNYISGLWALPNSVYVFINGPGINDIADTLSTPTTPPEAIALGEGLAWQVAAMASKVLNDGSEAVLNECCFLETGHASKNEFTDLAVTTYNNTLAIISSQLSIPIAKTAAGILADADTFYNADHIHLTIAGDEFMADAIVTAYEGNLISVAPGENTSRGFNRGFT